MSAAEKPVSGQPGAVRWQVAQTIPGDEAVVQAPAILDDAFAFQVVLLAPCDALGEIRQVGLFDSRPVSASCEVRDDCLRTATGT